VVPIEEGPYQNTDLGSGHGTHVAGIIAADGTTDPTHIGVAPDAELVCYSIGEVLFTTAVVTAYDHLLDQPDLWNVDVVNNSWVISVAAGTLDHQRGNFSSNGLIYDNSQPVPSAGGHSVFIGDRIGVYHPDVTAPGVDISSTCDGITKLKVTLSHPSLTVVGRNGMQWTVTVRDGSGRVIGTTTEATTGAGTASVLIDFASLTPRVAYSTFTFTASSVLAVSDPDTLDSESLLGRTVVLQVAQLAPG